MLNRETRRKIAAVTTGIAASALVLPPAPALALPETPAIVAPARPALILPPRLAEAGEREGAKLGRGDFELALLMMARMAGATLQNSGPTGPEYEPALAAITNRKFHFRELLPVVSAGASLSDYPWQNEGSVGLSVSASGPTYEVPSQNGLRGLLSPIGTFPTGSFNIGNLLSGGSPQFTAFAVERRFGSQGNNAGLNIRVNSVVFGGSDYWSLCFNNKEFVQYVYTSNYFYQYSGFSFSDNQPYVIGWRMSSTGAMRFNFNGQVQTFASSTAGPGSLTTAMGVCRTATGSGGASRGFEYIATSDFIADAAMDNMVAALMGKWGITA